MTSALLSLVLAAGALTGWPRPAGGPVSQAAVGVQLDGAPAVVVVAGEELVAFRADGRTVSGFPVALGAGEVASGAPAAIDRAGRPDIAVATGSGQLHLFSGSTPVKGFPAKLGARVRSGPSFADVDGDGQPEILVGDARGRLHALKRSGEEARGWPVSLGSAVTSTATFGRFGGGLSVAVGCADGKVHVLDAATRQERPGFPLQTGYEVTGAPVLADLDGDGETDLVVASQDFKLYALDGRARPLPGFPVETGYRIYEGPAVGDLDGEGKMVVAFTSADGLLHLVDAAGQERPGFPVRLGARVFGGAVMGDLDRDGRPDVAAVSADGNVVAVDREGHMLAGFPTRFEATDLGASPALLDLAGDQSLSLVVGFPGGDVHAIRALRFGTVAARAPWPVPGHDAARSGHAAAATSYHALALEPAAPRTGDGLRARWRWAAPDAAPGSAEPPVQIDWYRNGGLVADLSGKREVPALRARKGETWRFALVPANGTIVYRSPEVRVVDTPPSAPELALEPARPARGADVKAVLVKPARDPDGDEVSYRWEWLLDGLPTGVSQPTFPGDRLRRGMLLTARVVASDGEAVAETASAEARIADTPPGPVTLALQPPAPRRSDAVVAQVTEGAPDPDGDPVVFHYRWTVDGEPRNLHLGMARLPPGSLRKHQKVAVEARAFDGELEGPSARAEVVTQNSPPGAPVVEILPRAPHRGEALRAVLIAEAPDADGDPLTYRWAWKKNGAPLALSGDGREVPGREVARGDRFEVEVVASDGEAVGPPARAVAVAVDTPPTAPRLAIEPARPSGGARLEARLVEPSQDSDGDAIRYGWSWTRDGNPVAGAAGPSLAAGVARKHERVRVTVTPHDGFAPGASASAECLVENAPPTRPEVALEPREPTALTGLKVVVKVPATDPDGDPIVYHHAWWRDGLLTEHTGPDLKPGEVRHGEHWQVVVRAFDGEVEGEPASASAAVRNTPPPAPAVAIRPEVPAAGQALSCQASAPPRDADGEPIELRYRWYRRGEPVALGEGQAELPAGVVRRGDVWRCEAWASDGAAESARLHAEVTVKNSPPSAPQVLVEPEAPRRGDALACRIAAEASDPDGDKVTYRYAWTLDGAPVAPGADPSRIPADRLRRGQRWSCLVTASDGQLEAPPAQAERSVLDSPPGPARVRVAPAAPRPSDPLRCEVVQKSEDPDGDPVRYTYAWFRNGEAQAFAATTEEVPVRLLRAGDRWRCVVTPGDGELSGPPAGSAEVTVRPGGDEPVSQREP